MIVSFEVSITRNLTHWRARMQWYALCDIPHVPSSIEFEQSIWNSNFVESCFLFIPEEGIWDPDFIPSAVTQFYLFLGASNRFKF